MYMYIGVLDGGGDCRRERAAFWEGGVKLGRPIVTNGAFATRSSQISLRTCWSSWTLSKYRSCRTCSNRPPPAGSKRTRPSQRSVWSPLFIPKRIFVKWNWTPGITIEWLYVGLCHKTARLDKPPTIFPVTSLRSEPPAQRRCYNCPGFNWTAVNWTAAPLHFSSVWTMWTFL